MSVNVRVSGALRQHVEHTTSDGDYENVSEYVRDLIRRDKAAKEQAAFDQVKSELQAAFATPESAAEAISADDIRKAAKARLNA